MKLQPSALPDTAARSVLTPLFPVFQLALELKMDAYLCFCSVLMQHSPSFLFACFILMSLEV